VVDGLIFICISRSTDSKLTYSAIYKASDLCVLLKMW